MGAMSITECEKYAQLFHNSDVEADIKLRAVLELKDSMDIVHSHDYPRFLAFLVPAFSYILKETPIVFTTGSPIHKLRNAVIEIIHRFPLTEVLRPYSPDIMTVLMHVLKSDNEENAVVALKVIVELHKVYKQELEGHVQSFFDVVLDMYRGIKKAVVDTFDDPSTPETQATSPAAPSGTGEDGKDSSKPVGTSMTSFKVLTECPIIIALLLQVHKNYVHTNVPAFVPLILDCLLLQPKPQRDAHEAAAREGKVFFGVAPEIKNRVAYSEFKALQVKTASFIAYILRSFVQMLKPHQEQIADAIVGLLKDCPPEASATRKELLVAIRHIWYTEFKTAFVKHFDVLLNENVLIGAGVTSHETLRPLAHSILVDLIHHIRSSLNETQLSATIHMYARNLHDDSLAPNIQNMCAKLLVNLVDCLQESSKPINRLLLIRILEAFSLKFTALKNAFPCVMKHHHHMRSNPPNVHSVDSYETVATMDGYIDLGIVQPIKTSSKAFDATHDLVKDMRFLLKIIIQGIKPVLQTLRAFNPPGTGISDSDPQVTFAAGFSADEVRLFARIFHDGLQCFDYFASENFGPDGELLDKNADRSAPLVAKDEKEVFESFAAIFTYVEPCVFQDVFSTQMPYLFDRILMNGGLQAIPQYLLGLVNVGPNPVGAPNFTAVSPSFGGLLLRFLVDRIESLSGDDTVYSSSMLRLYKVVFMAVTKYPEKNEHILKPHVGAIIMKSMKLSSTAKDPLNYFLLLRALFRSIGGGRFEALYQEVLPLLEVLLEGLNVLLATANKQSMKELFVELCLTVPVRLNVLLPYLSYLMKPLVLALQGSSDLVSQGLRTLELCIDNLTQDFLEPIMTPVIHELMESLWKHLRPLPYKWEHSHTTLRILGKLGGRNRRLLNAGPRICGPELAAGNGGVNSENGIELLFAFHQKLDKPQVIALDPLIAVAQRLLEDPDCLPFHQEQVFLFAKACLPLLVSVDDATEDLVNYVLDSEVNPGDAMEVDSGPVSPFIDPPLVKKEKKEASDRALSDVLLVLYSCTVIAGTKERAIALLENLCQHFAFLAVAEALDVRKKQKGKEVGSTIDVILNSPTSAIDGFITAIVRSMTSESPEQRSFTERCLILFYSMTLSIVQKNGKLTIDELPVFHILASKFNSCCYKQEWFEKSAGCLGISLLTSRMEFGIKWMLDHELEFIKALLYVLKDVSPEMATSNAESAKEALIHVLKVCNATDPDAEMSEESATESSSSIKVDRVSKFNSLISLLISELSNSNSSVRETIQSTFHQLAQLTGKDVSALLTPVKDRLLQPIFSKPLRALPFALQIGHIDAITYCLSLRPSFLVFDDQLVRLLSEALALADAEDQALVSKPSHYKNSASLTNLRVVCIKLLSAAMSCADFNHARQVNTRARIIAVFFKSLYAKSSEVVDVAYQGLALVLSQQQKLPKELLQAGLKPILVNLQEYKRLTVSGLEGLARLLELLTSYFKVEIGKKLLDHCRQWAEPSVLVAASARPLSEIEEIKIMVAILNVFHLLPSAANCFMEELVKTVLDLETGLKRSISSPFRTPLVKYLNRYSAEAMDFFFERLNDPQYASLFVAVLADEGANPLRVEVLNNTEKMIAATYENNEMEASTNDLQAIAIQIVKVVSIYRPTWLLQEQKLGAHVRSHWKRIRNSTELIALNMSKSQEFRNLLEVFITVATHDPSQFSIHFEILEGFGTTEILDYGFLKSFFFETVCQSYSPAQRRAILQHFWEEFSSPSMSAALKTLSLRYMIIPILQTAHQQKCVGEIIDSEMISLIQSRLWHPSLVDHDLSAIDDFLRAELVQLSSLLIQIASSVIAETKKDVIKFAWNQIKVEDTTCKQASYVLLAMFVHEFETPPKIATQIYYALLKAHQSEIRVLVKQALDVLLPVAAKRMGSPMDSSLPAFARWTKKVISEEGHNMSQLLTLYQLLIRHADLFFAYRDSFIINILSSFTRLGLLANATAETKTISIDLCELILKWEKMRVKNAESGTMEVDENEQDIASATTNMETVIGYLIRFVSTPLEANIRPSLVGRALVVLKSLLELWPNATIKFGYFDKAVSLDLKDENYPIIKDTIDVLEVVLENRNSAWIIQHLSFLQKPIELWLQSENQIIVKSMTPILTKLYTAALSEEAQDPSNASDVTAFLKMIENVTGKLLKATTNIFALLTVLKTVSEVKPEFLDEHTLGDLMRLLLRLAKDHLLPTNNNQPGSETLTTMLIMLLELVRTKMSNLKDFRRPFHDCLAQLIAESQDVTLLHCLLKIVDDWIFRHNEAFPTLKEKANLVFRMMIYETRGDKDLSESYSKLISSIYNDPKFARTELTVRLEKAFLMGTKSDNPSIREAFSETLNSSLETSLFPRLQYVIGIQNWEFLSNTFWIRQALDLLLGVIDWTQPVNSSCAGYRVSATNFGIQATHTSAMAVDSDPKSEHSKYITFLNEMRSMDVGLIVRAAREFNYLDADISSSLWISLFPLTWNLLSVNERLALTKLLILLLGKDFHLKQTGYRPNVVATLLEGACKCIPAPELPPQLVKYAAKNFNTWHISLEMLQNSATSQRGVMSANKEEERLKEITLDALGELLTTLSEDDYFSGLWRRRCLFAETNAAVSFEQCGLWAQSQSLYEIAQAKARTGLLPFTESEYNLWEDQWVTSAKKLQQWDLLLDLAKHEGNTEMVLESAWRLSDWFQERESLQLSLKALPDTKSPRKKIFEALLSLLKSQEAGSPDRENFKRLCDEGIQLVLQNWFSLPTIVSNAHIPLLHTFQVFVELQEAAQIQENLLATNVTNIEQKSQELKGVLITWRERLPNVWDDIVLWSDLVAWRQHVFSTINKAYVPLIPQLQPQGGANNPTSSYAYRGFHETAWTINRFSHVARKHQLTDVCISSLTKIYTLPNIEIPEAFYKLREQAKCHFQSPIEYPTGLDVINNTNLHYFSKPQSAEFFTLKGVFLAKMGLHEDAVQAFSSATQMEMALPKAWAAWGQYNDQLFKEKPTEIVKYGVQAVQCYLQAAGIYNNARSRKYIARLIWLMGLDDANQTLSQTFDNYKSETPLWYWITFIPQLLSALSGKEAKYARSILMKIAKVYPQALHFQLRTTKEDFTLLKKQAVMVAAAKANEAATSVAGSTPAPTTTQTPGPSAPTPSPAPVGTNDSGAETSEKEEDKMQEDPKPNDESVKVETGASVTGSQQPPAAPTLPPAASTVPQPRKQPWEYVEEIMALLKTAFPLLTLSMETMVDQINQRLKPSGDEEIYRLVAALLSDGIQQLSKDFSDTTTLTATTEMNLARFADSMKPNHMKYKTLFEEEFIKSKPNLTQLVDNFRNWRDKLEIFLDNRPRKQHLEYFSHYLVEFEYQKFDEIEVPGQYFLLKDNSKDFVRIDRFSPEVEVMRGTRRVVIRGHDGTLHPFIIQHPAARTCRREERIMQLFRILNGALERKKESRRRGLQFHLPVIIPLGPMVRMVTDDPSYRSLQDIYEDHCHDAGIHRDDPILYFIQKMREIHFLADGGKKGKVEILNLKTELMEDIANRMVPENILTKYMIKNMKSYADLWNMRKQFTNQMAAVTFMTYIFSIGARQPHKFHISIRTGDVWTSDVLPMISNTFLISNTESVPFRLTPNIQHFITPMGMEGVFTSALMSIARGLTEPESDLEDYLSIFIRDELITFQSSSRKPAFQDNQLRDYVNLNCDLLVKRTNALACKAEREKGVESGHPANQTILDLISQAGNPLKLAQMDATFMAML